jgi:hypothetical protein
MSAVAAEESAAAEAAAAAAAAAAEQAAAAAADGDSDSDVSDDDSFVEVAPGVVKELVRPGDPASVPAPGCDVRCDDGCGHEQ